MNACCVRYFAILVIAIVAGTPAAIQGQQIEHPSQSYVARAAEDSLLSRRERAQWDAFKTRDTTTFARLMGTNVVDVDLTGIRQSSRASTAQYVLGCQVTSYSLSDLRVSNRGVTATVTYKATIDATCWGQKAPSPLYVMTVYERHGDTWLPVAHSETPAGQQ
jgi:ketosteroid isomerase-like protein